MTQWFKKEGDLIYLLGEPRGSLAGSEYLALLHGQEAGLPAPVDLIRERTLHEIVRGARDTGLIVSAHDCAEGGLAFALAECCVSGPKGALGAEIRLEPDGRLDELLFGEAPTRVIVTAAPEYRARLEQAAGGAGIPARLLGRVSGSRISISVAETSVVDMDVVTARAAWRTALQKHLRSQT
jgi:phosphoribosylformylglycinamidine synthase